MTLGVTSRAKRFRRHHLHSPDRRPATEVARACHRPLSPLPAPSSTTARAAGSTRAEPVDFFLAIRGIDPREFRCLACDFGPAKRGSVKIPGHSSTLDAGSGTAIDDPHGVVDWLPSARGARQVTWPSPKLMPEETATSESALDGHDSGHGHQGTATVE
jgi:hypothetical protein